MRSHDRCLRRGMLAGFIVVCLLLSGGPAGVVLGADSGSSGMDSLPDFDFREAELPVSLEVPQGDRAQELSLDRLHSVVGPAVSRASLAECLLEEPCSQRLDWFLWTESLSVEMLAGALQAQLGTPVPMGLPLPPQLPDYAGMSEADQREAWRAWYLFSLLEQQRSSDLPLNPYGPFSATTFDASGGGDTIGIDPSEGPGAARELSGLWRLEGHGFPIEVIPADANGATFLLTTNGLLYFPGPDERPQWMVRPASMVTQAEPVVDAQGNVEKVVMGTMPSMVSKMPSVIVVDKNGNTTWSGFPAGERLLFWSLSDVDGDGALDIIGLDWAGRAVASKLDGTLLYREMFEEPPSPGFISPPLAPAYLYLYYMRQGGTMLADVEGDGTLDFVVPGIYTAMVVAVVLFESYQVPMLHAYSGKDLEPLWVAVEPPSTFITFRFPIDAGDVNGDGRDDLYVYSIRFESLFPVPATVLRYSTQVLSGEGGVPLVRDDHILCITLCVPVDGMYQPMALINLDGDGQSRMLTAEMAYGSDWMPRGLDLVLREPGPVPGGPSREVARHTVSLDVAGELMGIGANWKQKLDGAQEFWVHVYSLSEEDDARQLHSAHHVLDDKGLSSWGGGEGMGMVDRDERSGQFYGWMLETDRWGALDEDLRFLGDGTRLVVSVVPLFFHDKNGDGVPDPLLAKTLGYRWVDGRKGTDLGQLPSRVGSFLVQSAVQDGSPVLLEWDLLGQTYDLYSLDGTRHWSLDLEGGWLRMMGDVMGDGALEVLFEEPGDMVEVEPGWYTWEPGDLVVWSMPDEEKLWSTAFDWWDSILLLDLDTDREGLEILKAGRGDSYWDLELGVYAPEAEEPLWEMKRGDTEFRSAGDGVVVIAERSGSHGDADRLELLDGATGDTLHKLVLERPSDNEIYRSARGAYLADVTGNGTADLIYSYSDMRRMGERWGDHAHHVWIVDGATGQRISQFRLSDPIQVESIAGWTSTYYSQFNLLVGDWSGSGGSDLAFIEKGRPVVRSVDGDVLAVGPHGAFHSAVDLNGDGRKEVAFLQAARLRMMAYAQGGGLLEDDDEGIERVENPDEVHHEEEGASGVFDDRRGLPAPAIGLVLLLVGAFVGLRRRSVTMGRERAG